LKILLKNIDRISSVVDTVKTLAPKLNQHSVKYNIITDILSRFKYINYILQGAAAVIRILCTSSSADYCGVNAYYYKTYQTPTNPLKALHNIILH